ncbi:MAG: DUF72 domain-containing protein [Flavipsychrobacter sp.]|nr:DUF72 domain-containing protein [Flavipsychrobacter sp.]
MDFGRLPENELNKIDFRLPPDPKVTMDILAAGKGNTKFYIGCAKWGRKDWVGKLYPKGTKEKDFFKVYAEQFNAIEFNGFFYNLHPAEQVRKWKSIVTKDFLFCPKFTQSITHYKRLKDTEYDVDQYLSVISEFGNNLGPIFLMPHPNMSLKQLDTIEQFIIDIPHDVDLFLELRSPDWYSNKEGYNTDLYTFLKKQKRGTVITDAAGRRDCVHMHLSTPETFIRFVGNGLHPTDYTRIDEWVERIGKWMGEGLETCYFFMHQHDELHSPELIKYFIQKMNTRHGTDIKPPVMYNDGGLFG